MQAIEVRFEPLNISLIEIPVIIQQLYFAATTEADPGAIRVSVYIIKTFHE